MQCSAQIEADVAILHLQGRLDAASVSEFRELAHGQLRAGHTKMVLDFSQIEKVDGQALAGIVTFYRRLTVEHKGRMAISGLNPELRLFLDRTSLSRVIPISYDWKDAVREVRG